MTSFTGSERGGFCGIWEKWVIWVPASEEEGWLSKLAEALWRVRTWFGADGKISIERWYLSPYVEKPFNSKVIKSFVPELRSRQVFFVFRDSYVIYEHFVNIICTFHIFMYCYVTPASEGLGKYILQIVYINMILICTFVFDQIAGVCSNGGNFTVTGESLHGIVVNEVGKFEFHSRYYEYFRTNPLSKGASPLILVLWIRYIMKGSSEQWDLIETK